MAKIITCCAQKGGCAKTVTVHNLAAALAEKGCRVLTVDLDPQANLTMCFGFESPSSLPVTTANLLDRMAHDEELPAKEEYILHPGPVDLIASSTSLAGISETIRLEYGSEIFLKSILKPLRASYDYILVDTGPKLDNLAINALVAADSVLIPVNPQYFSTMGLENLLKTVKKIKRRFNPALFVEGILLTMYEPRKNLCKVITEQIREAYLPHIRIFSMPVPMTIRVGEAVYYSKSILDFCPASPAAEAYRSLAAELLGEASGEAPAGKEE